MRILSTISFVVLIGLICLTQPTLSDKCLEYVNILDGLETRAVDCPRIISPIDKRQAPTSDNMFVIKFTCSIDNQDLCSKVNNVYNTAGQFITATLNLKAIINVNAQLQDFCVTQKLCNSKETILGAGKPSRLIPFQDPNDKMRFYPQALHKQLNLPEHPEYGPDDITVVFNSNVQYWFEGDQSLSANQVDMLYVVIHELVHGLGFVPAWNDNLNIEALTPGLGISQNTGKFLEVIFDKYLVLYPSGQPFTAITDQLNQFKFDPSLSDDQIAQSFKASPQYSIAHDLFIKATTPDTMAFLTATNLPPNTQLTLDNVILLETSLSPFQPGSSIGHVDLKTYLKTGDFLMMYTYPHATLGQMMSNAGTANTTGPIGPKLRTLLGILGYEIKPNYVPPVQLSSFGDPNDVTNLPSIPGTSSNPLDPFNPFSGSSSISFNLMLSLVCILLIFIIIELN